MDKLGIVWYQANESLVAPRNPMTTSARSLVSDRDTMSPLANCRFCAVLGAGERVQVV